MDGKITHTNFCFLNKMTPQNFSDNVLYNDSKNSPLLFWNLWNTALRWCGSGSPRGTALSSQKKQNKRPNELDRWCCCGRTAAAGKAGGGVYNWVEDCVAEPWKFKSTGKRVEQEIETSLYCFNRFNCWGWCRIRAPKFFGGSRPLNITAQNRKHRSPGTRTCTGQPEQRTENMKTEKELVRYRGPWRCLLALEEAVSTAARFEMERRDGKRKC